MLDNFKRNINYLRISLTDRCNLRCTYCMPENGRTFLSSDILMTDNEIISCVKAAAGFGVSKIRLTGGEPLMRGNIIDLIKHIAAIDGINDIAITTNGILLKKYAPQLAEAGLNRVNISLDTMDPETYKEITRGGNVNDVIEGIKAARACKIEPIKINCVVERSKNEASAKEVGQFCTENNLDVRFIRKMDLQEGIFYQVDGGDGGNCGACNRMRLTSDGYFKPCLFDAKKYSIRELGVGPAFLSAVQNKPVKGTFDKENEFYNIGG